MAPFLALGIRTIRAARDAGGVGNGAANRLAGGAAPQNSLRAREFRLQPAGLRSAGRGPGSQPSSFASSKNMSTQARLIQVGRRSASCWRTPRPDRRLGAHDSPPTQGVRGCPGGALEVPGCPPCQAAASKIVLLAVGVIVVAIIVGGLRGTGGGGVPPTWNPWPVLMRHTSYATGMCLASRNSARRRKKEGEQKSKSRAESPTL